MEYTYGINDDYLDDDDDGIMYSTRNYCSDSDEDNQSVFLPMRNPKKKLNQRSVFENDEDEFEKEMAVELRATMKRLTSCASSSTSKDEDLKDRSEPTYYDNIYFDSDKSDSEEEDGPSPSQGKRKAKKHRVLSNEELLYDPLLDDIDQAWVDKNRRAYRIRSGKSGVARPEGMPQSDAVLNCPACFTTLCHDCQRHEIYKNQYRAMFVFNCSVDKTELLHFAIKQDKKKKFKKAKRQKVDEAGGAASLSEAKESASGQEPSSAEFHNDDESNDHFNPVRCTVCNTKVAVQDKGEVYHFFNVITSY